ATCHRSNILSTASAPSSAAPLMSFSATVQRTKKETWFSASDDAPLKKLGVGRASGEDPTDAPAANPLSRRSHKARTIPKGMPSS
ncbi:MAG: hypothetical protein ACJ8B9_15395, partial [Microvirga sp.]